MKVLIVGASGNVGKACVAACLARDYEVAAFLRTPSKLPEALSKHAKLRIVQGDAKDKAALIEAMKGQDALIQAACHGSPFGGAASAEAVTVVSTFIDAAKDVQAAEGGRHLRVWVMSGQNVLEVPGMGTLENDLLPIHPEHVKNLAYLREHGEALDWSVMCPGKLYEGEPVGPFVPTINTIGLWQGPGIPGKIPVLGKYFTLFNNFGKQRLSYKGVGQFIADSLGPGGDMTHQRIGLLEDPNAPK